MSMGVYPITGYGIGISYDDKEAILNLLNHDDIKEEWDSELDLTGDEKEDNEERLESFMDDPQASMETVVSCLSNKLIEKYPKERWGFDYDTANDDYIVIMFSNVRYGEVPNLTLEQVDRIIFELAKDIYKPEKDMNEVELDFMISGRNGLYGDINLTYIG